MHNEFWDIMSHNSEINNLLRCVERRIGRPLKSPIDFDLLSLRISESLTEQLSPTTLKRIWGYIHTEHVPRYSTLSTLARFVGYEDWDDFCSTMNTDTEGESSFLSSKQIDPEFLAVGDRIELRWRPDRRVVVIYNGNNGFTVQESVNSKIVAGDTFRAMNFMLGHPLYINELRHGGNPPQTYVAGRIHGLSSIVLLRQ